MSPFISTVPTPAFVHCTVEKSMHAASLRVHGCILG